MSVIQVQLPEQLQQVIDRQVAQGRVASETEFLLEAARRFAEDIVFEDEIVAEAVAGIRDADTGRFTFVETPEDEAALHERTMARLRERLAADRS
jgi:Arc/MetJ-type ribon-helix-helix transcriptional regulator